MQLFHNKGGRLQSIEKSSFKLERDIQTLVEENLNFLFDLEFVCTEFSIGGFRIDTLAFDEQNSSFAIIEYKKGSSYSVVDQGYSYLSVMLNNKADFILEYNEKTGKQLKRGDIDWSSSRVLFVAPAFNAYQRNSINFKDVPFELWEIRKFENSLIALDQHISSSNESIETVSGSTPNSVISSVSKEVKASSEEELISPLTTEMKAVWNAIKEKILELPDTKLHTTQNYVSIKYENKAIIYFWFTKKHITCEIVQGVLNADGSKSNKFFDMDDPKKIASVRGWTWKSGAQGTVHRFNLNADADVDYVMYLIKQKYQHMSD
jgi:hypothetical protein